MSKSSVFLIGMMGAGKTTVGRYLAEELNYQFIDTDTLVEKKEKRSIETIFKDSGEDYFRNIECEIIAQFKNQLVVYASGGGFPIYNGNIDKIKEIGKVVYLNTSIEELLKNRIKDNLDRPMFKNKNSFKSLLKQRESIYLEADFVVTTDSKNPKEVVREIRLLID